MDQALVWMGNLMTFFIIVATMIAIILVAFVPIYYVARWFKLDGEAYKAMLALFYVPSFCFFFILTYQWLKYLESLLLK